MCRKKYEYQPIGNSNVALVVQEIEIEARRLIIEYQRALRNEPPATQSAEQKPAALPSTTAPRPASAPSASAPMSAAAAVESQGAQSLDVIMPLPTSPKKKKLSIEDVESGKQIDIEEAIADATTAETQNPETPKPEVKPEAHGVSKPEAAHPMTQQIQQPSPPMQAVAPEPMPTFWDKWLDARILRSERKAEYKSRKQYFSSLETQIKNNVAPLEELIEFMHKKYGNN